MARRQDRLEAEDVADAIRGVVTRSRRVVVNELLIRPPDQELRAAGGEPRSLRATGPLERVPLPRRGLHAEALGAGAGPVVADHERLEPRETTHELEQAVEVGGLELPRLHLDGPCAPGPLDDAVDLERLQERTRRCRMRSGSGALERSG